MSLEIVKLLRRRVREAFGVLTRAFDEDPIITHYLNGRRRRRLVYPAFFWPIIADHLPLGHVYAALEAGRVRAVAVWRPPGEHPSPPGEARRAFLSQLAVRAAFPRRAGALFGGFAATEPLHPSEAHWYLFFVGVDAGHQGGGIGSQLLAPVLEIADRDGILCYLETPFPRTHEFYRRLGFQIASKSHPFEGAPPLWTMTREPRAASTQA